MRLFSGRQAAPATAAAPNDDSGGQGLGTTFDERVVQLTERADAIVNELDDVVQRMSELLKRKHR